MNIARVPLPFGTNMQLQNEYHLQPSSVFARKLHRTRDVTMAKGDGLELDESRLQLR